MTPTAHHRYVAIGDSATEGLEDPDPRGGYRGWADRLAMILSEHAQESEASEPVRYANLGIRGQVAAEVRTTQFDRALAMRPDLLSITAGVNDCLGLAPDFELITEHLSAMYSEARGDDATVITFSMPDPTTINPLAGRLVRERILRLNDIQRRECDRYDVLLLDLEQFPVAGDPRLWFDDRLHGNALGHERVARGMAWRLGLPGFDDWAAPLADEELDATGDQPQWRDKMAGDLEWARRHFGPWLVKELRGIRHGAGIEAKRPELTPVAVDEATADPD